MEILRNEKRIVELIDTLWNVNSALIALTMSQVLELIDTLWNVNTGELKTLTLTSGINRYIMECKLNNIQ